MTTMTQKTTRVTEAQGLLIEQFRNHTNIDAIVKAFAQQSQEVEDAAWQILLDTLIATAEGQQLDNLGTIVGVEREGKTDTAYRVRLQAQVLLNKSSGTIEDLLGMAYVLGATSNTVLTEVFPAKIEIVVNTVLATGGSDIGHVMTLARAAGVGMWFTWYEQSGYFKLDTVGQGLDQGLLTGIIAT